ncbi:ABC transporter permease [Vibrio sp. RE86]|uniref:ABC transporter permease n=1 Tax=Vibrio sp. RE86 TaxID=2607605 RepID=UPI0014933E24|nr:ABC transporter permease [Vibrio sp. RE86]NOH79471.1 ABC transporter permease [Vibrio sp. RE86]
MNSVVDISWLTLLVFFSLLTIPMLVSRIYQLDMNKEIILSVTRMTVQLLLVGVYLEFLFDLNSLLVNLIWLTLMTLIGASTIISKAKLPKSKLMFSVVSGLAIGLFPILTIITLFVVQPSPTYNAQYLIPLAGMLLGNSMSGNIVALQNFFNSLDERKGEYEAAIALGASKEYATIPFVQSAIKRSLAPTLATMTTSGLVTLPGMMTGQILGGASPLVAIKYQILIMVAIFVMMSISITVALKLTINNLINKEGRVLIKPLA